jgi:hypothetical protein
MCTKNGLMAMGRKLNAKTPMAQRKTRRKKTSALLRFLGFFAPRQLQRLHFFHNPRRVNAELGEQLFRLAGVRHTDHGQLVDFDALDA